MILTYYCLNVFKYSSTVTMYSSSTQNSKLTNNHCAKQTQILSHKTITFIIYLSIQSLHKLGAF